MRAKKSLGQNFLNSPSALKKIVDAGQVIQSDTILEIGPGKGVLTRELLEKAGKVIAIEKDQELIPILEDKFKTEIKSKKLVLINDDALKVNLEDLGLKNGQFKLIANIPYYITGQIIRQFLENNPKPTLMVLMVQKEVAERIAKSPKESILSLSVKAFGDPKYISTVPKTAFLPTPSVDSAILLINNISDKNFKNKEQEKRFFAILHAAFSQKRKMAINNLKKNGSKNIEEIFQKLEIDKKARAEDIPLKKWLDLSTF